MEDIPIEDIKDIPEDILLPDSNEPIILELSQDEMDMIVSLTVKS